MQYANECFVLSMVDAVSIDSPSGTITDIILTVKPEKTPRYFQSGVVALKYYSSSSMSRPVLCTDNLKIV